MKIEYDPVKSENNEKERGIPFSAAADFEWDLALLAEDDRKDYGEIRIRAFGFINARLHALVFTPITGGIRVISLRKANKREAINYEKKRFRID
jgi:uncharacterized DUF497 family protein